VYPPSGRERNSTGDRHRVQEKSGGGEVEPAFAAASLHSKGEEEASVIVGFGVLVLLREGVSKANETVERLPSSAGLLVTAGGSLGAAAHSPPSGREEAGTSLGEPPERTLAAAAAPWTVSANGCTPPKGSDLPLTTMEMDPPKAEAGEAPKETSGTTTRSALLLESLTLPPLPSKVAPPPGKVTSRSRSLTRAEAAAGEGGRSVQASVTTSGEGRRGVWEEDEEEIAFSRQKRTTPPSATVTLSAKARPHEL